MDSVGEILKNARLAKGLSLEQIETGTSIRKVYLAAIEEGEYHKIPGDVFTKGIIRTYGNYLDLNGPELVIAYKVANGIDETNIKPLEINRVASVNMAPQLKPQTNSRSVIVYLIGILVVLIIGLGGYWLLSTPKNPDPVPSKTVIENNNVDNNNVTPQPINTEVKLNILAKDKCWLEVIADDKIIFEGLLNSNESKEFIAKEILVVKYGNMQVVQETLNGKVLPQDNTPGVVVKEYKK